MGDMFVFVLMRSSSTVRPGSPALRQSYVLSSLHPSRNNRQTRARASIIIALRPDTYL